MLYNAVTNRHHVVTLHVRLILILALIVELSEEVKGHHSVEVHNHSQQTHSHHQLKQPNRVNRCNSGENNLFDPLLILYVCPLTKKWSVYNFNGRFILTVRDRIKKIK